MNRTKDTTMNTDRIKEIQQTTAYPESVSVQQALLQVWNECEQENKKQLLELMVGFWIWLVREAKIEVIDAEKAIELRGFPDKDGLVPVVSFKELVDIYIQSKGIVL